MKIKIHLFIVLFLSVVSGYAQGPLWIRTDGNAVKNSDKLPRESQPSQYTLYTLNLPQLKAVLQNAPLRGSHSQSSVIVPFPDGNGKLSDYTIYEASVLHPQLAVKYPGTKSYVGRGVTNPDATIHFSITQYGLHTMTLSSGGTFYTDPYTKDGATYIAYNRAGLSTAGAFSCGVTGSYSNAKSLENTPKGVNTKSMDGTMRTYRMAMACTIEYAAFHINQAGVANGTTAQKKAAVLDAMNVTVTRLNSVYERDLAITFELVPDNDEVIFIDSDNFDNANTDNILLEQSQQTIDAIIGFDNYDIGHTVSTGGGGVAQLWSPCSESKARGITGLGAPVGDPFDIDFVAHEVGHQFGGNHSFNNECGGNRSDDNAYEPGSGSTIMAYAGVCFPSVQNNSDAHFHTNSINEMSFFISTAGNCSQNVITGNVPPVVNAGADYTIPKGTAFILKGTATDNTQNTLTYCWEQMDREISVQPPVPDAVQGPNFRSLPPKNVPERYMPDLFNVLNNNLIPEWEVISNVVRMYNFAFTVRDNDVMGGQVVTDYMAVTVSGNAGPFEVTSPNTNVLWQAGDNRTVSWDVAGTTGNGVNAAYVDILLSTNGGLDYPIVLAAKVPNDGSEVITVPNLPGNANRIMVKGYNNIFYDITNSNFSITAPGQTMAIAVQGEQNKATCAGSTVNYTILYQALGGFTGATTFTATGIPAGAEVTFTTEQITATGNVTVTVNNQAVVPGFYTITVLATSGNVTKTVNLYMDVLNNSFSTIDLLSPVNNAPAVSSTVNFFWVGTGNATGYTLEIAADEAFTDVVHTATVASPGYTYQLAEGVTYYWRIQPFNAGCVGNYSETYSFRTGITTCDMYISADVPVIISDQENATITSTVIVSSTEPVGTITASLDISHTWTGDLTATLTSPQGTEIILFANVCDGEDNINATFTDAGSPLTCQGNPVISGTVKPQQLLEAFTSEIPAGIWTLTVTDNFAQDGGQVNNWGLTICSVQEVLKTKNPVSDKNISLYPNPNNGSFTLEFMPVSNNITVTVYDVSGRQVYSHDYKNKGAFKHDITTGGVQAGIYLVTVQDGNTKNTRKIIVK